jgi:chitosanase
MKLFVRRCSGVAIMAFASLSLVGCAGPGGASGAGGGDGNGNGGGNAEGLTPEQKLRAEQITSVFENDTIVLQYDYIENINDGRGYTAGRAGFTTATGDLILVVERYTELVPDNELAPLLPRLAELADAEDPSVEGLEGLPAAWVSAADDPEFRAVQDEIVDELYYLPAVARWRDVGLTTPLSLAALYDAIIQHGEGDDPDGLPAMIDRATERAGGDPTTGVDEEAWLRAFLSVRRETLEFAFDPETREAWALGADRPEVFEEQLDLGNFELDGPIEIDTSEHTATVP